MAIHLTGSQYSSVNKALLKRDSKKLSRKPFSERLKLLNQQQSRFQEASFQQQLSSAKDFQRRYAALKQQQINSGPMSALS